MIKVKIVKVFRDGAGNLYDPPHVDFEVRDSSGVIVDSGTATQDTLGVYSVEVRLQREGVYSLELDIGSDELVIEKFIASDSVSPDDPGESLAEDFIMEFSSGVTPLLVDPDGIKEFVPHIPAIDVMQAVHKFSLEISKRFPGGKYPDMALDYIHAASLCSLSRKFDGIGTASSYSGFMLGDFQVMDSDGKGGSGDRGTAGDWCQLAESLRVDMIRYGSGVKSTVKAGAWGRAHPDRRVDARRGQRRGRGY